MALQESGEMYLESIHVLSERLDCVHAVDICEYMGYSKPSVSRAMGILRNEGYINVAKDGAITLTERGSAVASSIYKRHTILTEFLKGLGVDEKTAATDACKIEHVISEESFFAIEHYIKDE